MVIKTTNKACLMITNIMLEAPWISNHWMTSNTHIPEYNKITLFWFWSIGQH